MASGGAHPQPIRIGAETVAPAEAIDLLAPYLTPGRMERIDRVVRHRTYSVIPVLEGLYDRGNVSAALRSAEALGYQAVHIIESSARFKEAKRVTQGAEKWLDITCWPTVLPCLKDLRAKGYRILATHFDGATPLADVEYTTPAALVFGNEREGVSAEVLNKADGSVVAPMPGFSRSYNISVAVALCLYHVYLDRVRRLGGQGDLSAEDREALRADFYVRSVPNAEKILLRG